MKKLSFTLLAMAALPASAAASSITIGSSLAEGCYVAAEDRDPSREAMDTCDRALREEALTSRDRVATHVNRGILHLNRANLRAANADFDAALALDPDEPEAWLNKAIGYARLGHTAEALPLADKALELKTNRPALAYFVRALALEDSGNIAAAYRDLKRAQSLEPTLKEATVELSRFQVRR
ncbi:MAG: hypothetical protein LOX97_10445 [Sphingomonas sp.]|nr:hypothetical protein [Sphingomonas sp.]